MVKFKVAITYIIVCVSTAYSCTKQPLKTSGKVADYQVNFPKSISQNVNLDFEISYDTLSNWIFRNTSNPIFKSSIENDFLGFPMDINLIGKPNFRAISVNKIGIKIPVEFNAVPKIAGFSAGKLNGKLFINSNLEIDILSITQMKVNPLNYDYSWVEKPMVKVGGFSINAAPVLDQVLVSKKDELFAQYVKGVKSLLNESNFEKWVVEQFVKLNFRSVISPNAPILFDLQQLKFQEKGLIGQLIFNTSFHLLETPDIISWSVHKPQVKFLKRNTSILTVSKVMTWAQIERQLSLNMLNNSKTATLSFSIKPKDNTALLAEIKGFSGARSNLKIEFNFIQIDKNTVGIDLISREINQLSWPRNWFKANALRRIDKFTNQVKIDLSKLTSQLDMSNLPIKILNPSFSFDQIHWNDSGVYFQGSVAGNWKLIK